MGIGIAVLLAAKFDISPDRYRKYLTIAIIGLVLLTVGAVRLLYRRVMTWFRREAKQHKVPN
jgi:small basic protein